MKSVVTLNTNSKARLTSDSKEVIDAVRSAFTFIDEKARFTPQFKRGLWDGKVSLIDFMGVFPIGLTPMVLEIIQKKFPSHFVTIVDKRSRPRKFVAKIPRKVGSVELRDYQYEMVESSFPSEINGLWFPRGIIYAATNAGKSLIAAAIAKIMLKNGLRVLFITHRQEILRQVVEWFTDQLGVEVGVYDRTNHRIKDVTVAMVSTIYARRKKAAAMDLLNDFDCLMVDEAQHSPAPSWNYVISASTAFFKFAFSGTALKFDDFRNLKLVGLFGPVVGRITNKELVERGFSAVPKITMVRYKNKDLNTDPLVIELTKKIAKCFAYLDKLESEGDVDPSEVIKMEGIIRDLRRKRYQHLYRVGITKSKSRALPIAEICQRSPEKSVLIVVNMIPHGLNIKHVLDERGINCTFVHGDTNPEEREQIRKRFISGKIKVLIASMVYKEGVNVPCIDILVMACGGKSPNTILQVFGRGLRKDPGKSTVDVYDFEDTSHETLNRHTSMRVAIYDGEGFTHKVETI